MLVTLAEILKYAGEGEAIGHFNFHNLEYIQGIIAGAEEMKKPVILGITERPLKYMGIEYVVSCARTAANLSSIPVCLHLDHGQNLEIVFSAIEYGFSSVMYDGSALPLEENINNTLKCLKRARAAGISLEAELGALRGREDGHLQEKDFLTDSEEAQYFIEKTGVDALAVAIGTAHGFYEREPEIDFDRLADINSIVETPLVLHGGSGVPDRSVRKAISLGVKKANVGTDLKVVSSQAIKTVFRNNPDEIELVNFMDPAREAIKDKVIEKIKLFTNS